MTDITFGDGGPERIPDAYRHWFRFEIQRWKGSRRVQRLNRAQKNTYFDMLLEQWEYGVLEVQHLDEFFFDPEERADVDLILQMCFIETPWGFVSERMHVQRETLLERRRKKQEYGRRGGEAKAANMRDQEDPSDPKHDPSTSLAPATSEVAPATESPSSTYGSDKKSYQSRGEESREEGTATDSFDGIEPSPPAEVLDSYTIDEFVYYVASLPEIEADRPPELIEKGCADLRAYLEDHPELVISDDDGWNVCLGFFGMHV